MQKSKSLLLKILVLVMVLCCALFCMTGCAAEESVGIKSAQVNAAGKLEITLTDGTVIEAGNVKGEDGKDVSVCQHTDSIITEGAMYYDELDVESDKCGFQLAFCQDCGHVIIVEFDHDTEVTDAKESTCTEVGYNAGEKCKNCSYAAAGVIEKKPHDTEEIKVVDIKENLGLNTCVDVWYTGEVCKVCGNLELTEQEPLGHVFTNIRVGTYATTNQKCVLVGDCSVCGLTAQTVVELPALGEDNDYTASVVATTQAAHTLKFVGTYNEVEYIVQPAFVVDHEDTVIDDYTAEKYPNIIFKTGEPAVNCASYVNGGYICDVCTKWIDATIKTAHTLSESVTEDVIKGDIYAAYGCEFDGEKVVTYDCAKCAATDVIEVSRTAYGHIWKIDSISKNATDEDLIDLHFVCEKDATHTDTIEGISDYEEQKANCSEDGLITYTDATGTKTLVVPANGKHVCEGATDNILENATITYDVYLTLKDKISFKPGVEITCGSTVEAGFICTTCNRYIAIFVEREHSKVFDPASKVEPTCASDGSIDWTCAYDDCKVEGTDPLYGKHTFEFVRMDDATLVVKCTTEGCAINGVENDITVYEKTSVTNKTCQDYAKNDKNYDQYAFTFTDDKDYVVYNYLDNNKHVLNNAPLNEGATVAYGTPGTYLNGDSAPANCKTSVSGKFICELCNRAIDINIQGTHAALTTQDVKSDELSCEEAAYKYYICGHDGCTERINIEKISDALTHDYKYTVVGGNVTFTCDREGCLLNKTVALADCTKVLETTDCVNITTSYTYAYKNGSFEQTFEFETVEPIGDHTFLSDAEGNPILCTYEKKVNNEVVETVRGYYCTACGKLIVTTIIPPRA